jgi:hypothetical protein
MKSYLVAFFDFVVNLMSSIGELSVVAFQMSVVTVFVAPVLACIAAGSAILTQQVAPEAAFHAALNTVGTIGLWFTAGSLVVGLLSIAFAMLAGLLYNLCDSGNVFGR